MPRLFNLLFRVGVNVVDGQVGALECIVCAETETDGQTNQAVDHRTGGQRIDYRQNPAAKSQKGNVADPA